VLRKCADFTGKPGGIYAVNNRLEEEKEDFSTNKKQKRKGMQKQIYVPYFTTHKTPRDFFVRNFRNK